MRLSKSFILPAFFAAALALHSCNAKVEVNVIRKTGIPMDGKQLIPASSGSATGTLDVEYNKDSHLLIYKLVWSGLSANAGGIQVYGTAGKGYNAVPNIAIQNLTSGFPPAPAATYFGSVFIDGSALKEDALYLGEYYIVIRTAAGAELRGQIELP